MTGPVRWLAAAEAGLALLGGLWIALRSLAVSYELSLDALVVSLGAAAFFLVVNLGLYLLGRGRRKPAAVYDFLEGEIFPLFRDAGLVPILLVSVLAGIGEEVFFRGAAQQEIGLWAASLLFGVLHGPSRSLWPLALWASAMGLALGLLYQATENLIVPILTHTLYDAAALIYLRSAGTGSCDS